MFWETMYSGRKNKKYIVIIIVVIAIIVIPCMLQYAIQYYFHPIKNKVDISTTGLLIYNEDVYDYEAVQVEIKGGNLNYIYKNNNDGIQGDIWVNGYSIFGNGIKQDDIYSDLHRGFYSEFHSRSNYACTKIYSDNPNHLCEIIAMSKDWNVIVCGVTVNSNISSKIEGDSEEALLVIAPDNVEEAGIIIEEVAFNSIEMNDWLINHGWTKYINQNIS